jgi:hypothetical protein
MLSQSRAIGYSRRRQSEGEAMKHMLRAAALLMLCTSAAANAQQAAPPPPDEGAEPIVVTGERPVPGLVVDVARVAQRCIACRRALRQLRAQANRNRMAPMLDSSDEAGGGGQNRREEWLFSATRERNAIVRDPAIENRLPPAEGGGQQRRDEFGTEVGLGFAVAADDHRNSLRTQEDSSRRASRAIDRAEAGNGGARFTENLLRAIEPIVERHRQERRAEAVYGAGDPAIAGRRFPDITDAVIEELDRNHRNLNLLDDDAR